MTIVNKVHSMGDFRRIELNAYNGSIYPGMLVEANAPTTVRPHSTAGGFAELAFAEEDALQGLDASVVYTTGSVVRIAIEQRGSLVGALLKAGFNYTAGTKLISAGDGTLKPTTGSPTQIIAGCVDLVDLSASSAVNTLAIVRIW